MVKDLVDEVEPKGVPVPVGDADESGRKKPKRVAPLAQIRDIVVPKKRLKSQHRKAGAGLSLKAWAKSLKEPDEKKTVQQWLDGKRRQRREQQDKG
jgi:hypothetical protein